MTGDCHKTHMKIDGLLLFFEALTFNGIKFLYFIITVLLIAADIFELGKQLLNSDIIYKLLKYT